MGRENCYYRKSYSKYPNSEFILENMEQFHGGISFVSSNFAKGLEFNCVIITDLEEYTDSILDSKLLYIAITRNMHELKLISAKQKLL